MSENSMREWNLQTLTNLYAAESKLEAALPQLVATSQSPHLRGSLLRHLLFKKIHAQRLREILDLLGRNLLEVRSPIMEGILEELNAALEGAADGEVRDSVTIGTLLRAHRYQMAEYQVALKFGGLVVDEDGLDSLSESLEDIMASREEFEELAFRHLVKGSQHQETNPAYLGLLPEYAMEMQDG